MNKFVFSILFCSLLSFPAFAAINPTDNAGTEILSAKSAIEKVNLQIKTLNSDLYKKEQYSSDLRSQIFVLHTQKRLPALEKQIQEMSDKIALTGTNNATPLVAEWQARKDTLQKELSLEQDGLNLFSAILEAKNSTANAQMPELMTKFKENRQTLRDLQASQIETPAATVSTMNMPATNNPLSKTEDPEIRALLDQMKPLLNTITSERLQLSDLKKQRKALIDSLRSKAPSSNLD
jgi:chromosome segregation ATPase